VLLGFLLKKYRADPDALRLWEQPLPVAEGTAPARGSRRKRRR
jgi:hypothetical protein